MKRSEMVELLMKHMDEDVGYRMNLTEADHILRVLEDAGMLPPSAKLRFGDYNFEDNFWESESTSDEDPEA